MGEHKNIAAALAAAQQEMGKALKDSTNPHFRSKYADLGNVMDACMPALNKHGISVFQPVGRDEHGTYVDTVLLHTSGERLECRVPLILGKNDMQGFGSAQTYARRYGLMTMAGIAPEDDDGNAAAASAKANPPRQQAKPAPKQDNSQAVAYLTEAETLDDLKARFVNLPGPVKADPDVIAAKDARKAALDKPAPAISDDEIPY